MLFFKFNSTTSIVFLSRKILYFKISNISFLLLIQTWFFSDTEDPWLSDASGGRLVNTGCSDTHNRSALCCKMAAELAAFVSSKKR